MEQYELTVNGMSCSSCEKRVSNAAKQVDGVHQVQVSHESNRVEITGAERTKDAVRKSIYKAGYDVIV